MAKTKTKLRLDQLLVERGLVESRNKAQALIRAGKVLVSEVIIDKPGTTIKVDAPIRLKESIIVSRGGLKLEGAMKHFQIDCSDWICARPRRLHRWIYRLSLSAKAGKIYAIDVGYGQLAWKVRQDSGSS